MRTKNNKKNSHKNKRTKKKHRRKHPKKKPSTFKKVNRFTRKYPVWTGIILIIVSIVLFRISFTNTFLSQPEIFMWAIILSIGLFIAGVLVLTKYWRNNVSMFTTRHNVNWRNR